MLLVVTGCTHAPRKPVEPSPPSKNYFLEQNWEKPDASLIERKKDMYECRKHADVQRAAWQQRFPYSSSPEGLAYEDALWRQIFQNCMETRGYNFVEPTEGK